MFVFKSYANEPGADLAFSKVGGGCGTELGIARKRSDRDRTSEATDGGGCEKGGSPPPQ